MEIVIVNLPDYSVEIVIINIPGHFEENEISNLRGQNVTPGGAHMRRHPHPHLQHFCTETCINI